MLEITHLGTPRETLNSLSRILMSNEEVLYMSSLNSKCGDFCSFDQKMEIERLYNRIIHTSTPEEYSDLLFQVIKIIQKYGIIHTQNYSDFSRTLLYSMKNSNPTIQNITYWSLSNIFVRDPCEITLQLRKMRYFKTLGGLLQTPPIYSLRSFLELLANSFGYKETLVFDTSDFLSNCNPEIIESFLQNAVTINSELTGRFFVHLCKGIPFSSTISKMTEKQSNEIIFIDDFEISKAFINIAFNLIESLKIYAIEATSWIGQKVPKSIEGHPIIHKALTMLTTEDARTTVSILRLCCIGRLSPTSETVTLLEDHRPGVSVTAAWYLASVAKCEDGPKILINIGATCPLFSTLLSNDSSFRTKVEVSIAILSIFKMIINEGLNSNSEEIVAFVRITVQILLINDQNIQKMALQCLVWASSLSFHGIRENLVEWLSHDEVYDRILEIYESGDLDSVQLSKKILDFIDS